jgi:hypothetical protein
MRRTEDLEPEAGAGRDAVGQPVGTPLHGLELRNAGGQERRIHRQGNDTVMRTQLDTGLVGWRERGCSVGLFT